VTIPKNKDIILWKREREKYQSYIPYSRIPIYTVIKGNPVNLPSQATARMWVPKKHGVMFEP
jgi:hypothetical protein